MIRLPLRRRAGRTRGQTLVEFALVFPIFFVMFMGMVEFAFAFNAILSVNFASRNASLYASEAGNTAGADCVILSAIERDVSAPANAKNITKIEIYRAKSNGDQYSTSEITTFTRTGSLTCTFPDLTTQTVPYTRTGNGYPESARCNILAGCGGTHTGVDHIGVRIYYTHPYVTPLSNFVGTGSSIQFDRANVMRLEPNL
jgi:Flp pilus assembly protein TadG